MPTTLSVADITEAGAVVSAILLFVGVLLLQEGRVAAISIANAKTDNKLLKRIETNEPITLQQTLAVLIS